ncbi:MAG TPA: bifunctional hydroxymethylpyrimidine kinase/phosphomethylpyrimidine kinase [Aquifex aeolicus]|nr:bifunctional hydroxymethylpyrimidine kinase/phosphomethylpyrimidine kinase [Aquifex aeolicus]
MQLFSASALTVAGFDNSGGAGVLADIRTFRKFGIYGVAVITAIVVQNTQEVFEVFPLPSEVVRKELEALFGDINIQGVKIGMLANSGITEEIYNFFKEKNLDFIILDPVFRSKSGKTLLDEEGIKVLKEKLIKLTYLITPNVPEAEILCGKKINTIEDVYKCAKIIKGLGTKNVLIKGGHLKGETSIDILYDGKDFYEFKAERIEGKKPRGTGCVFSSAILANLIKGARLIEAVKTAKEFITEAIDNSVKIGKGYEIMIF